jgi:cation diffusion facilitator family transporter
MSGQPHTDEHTHSHSHGTVDPELINTRRGMQAIKWSFVALLATALFQTVIVVLSGSVALFADTIHNFGDVATAIPLWIAFSLSRRKPNKRFTYGYGRLEDLAGVVIVLTILVSAIVAGYESIRRFINPGTVNVLWTVAVASLVGFLGNEAVARFRIKVGREIDSAALVADGQHARVDGLTSLSVLLGSAGVWLGYPLADPIVGLFISVAILRIVWQSGRTIFTRLIDGVDPAVIDDIKHTVSLVQGVVDVAKVRARWLGHRLHAELNVSVKENLTVEQGHAIALKARHRLLHRLTYLSGAVIHIDPVTASGEEHHRVNDHRHDDLPAHSH